MRVPNGRGTVRMWVVAAVAVTAAVATACAPPPEADLGDMFEGGTYPVEIVVEPQTVTTEFSLFGLVNCTSTSVTPSVDIRGSLTVAPAELDPGLTEVTIPGASLELPASTVSAGSLTLSCNGSQLGTIGVSLQFDGAASVQAAVLDLAAGTISLGDPTITLTNVRATFAGAPAGTAPTPLAPITVTVPTIDVVV
jgi:hypothetical protein